MPPSEFNRTSTRLHHYPSSILVGLNLRTQRTTAMSNFMIPTALPPLDMLPELSAESSASTSGSGPSQPATPADEESFAQQLDLFATPRKSQIGDEKMAYSERARTLSRLAVAVREYAQGVETNFEREDSLPASESFKESAMLESSSSASGHQILVRSPTANADENSPSLSPDMPSLGRSTLYRQPNVTFGLTPLLGTLPSSGSLAGNVSHAALSESNTTSSMSLASAPDSMLAIISPRPELEAVDEAPAPFPIIDIGSPNPQFVDRSLTAEGYEGDSDREGEDAESSLGSGDDYTDTLVSSASELDYAGLTNLIMRDASNPSNASDNPDTELSEPFAPLSQDGVLFPLSLARDLALTPFRLAILGAAQLLHPALLPTLLFGPNHTLWPRTSAPLGGIRRLEAYAHALQGAGFTFLFVLLLLWQLGGPVGRAIAFAALSRAAWVWGAFELDIDRAMALNEDVACAWAVSFSKEREVVGWMAQRARMEMDLGEQRRSRSEVEST
ncbi:unnamed protein product [Peniophora sp. CBMAI 1063]|nr:unnamed protein product [Peniophora sp. CBMAI 1063]